jgi:hypothetical protein
LNYAARTLRLKRSTSLAHVGMNELLDGMLLASGEECINVLFRVQVTLTKQREHLDATFFDAPFASLPARHLRCGKAQSKP